MDYPLIFAIGRIEKSVCPCCGLFLTKYLAFKVMLKGRKESEDRIGRYRLFYCKECNLPFTTQKLSTYNKSITTGYYLPEFPCNGSSLDPNRIREQMGVSYNTNKYSQSIQRCSQTNSSKNEAKAAMPRILNSRGKRISFPIVDLSQSVNGINIYTMMVGDEKVCYKCLSKLKKSATFIPINKKHTQFVKVSGGFCKTCGILYVSKSKKCDIEAVLTDNKNATAFKLIEKYSEKPLSSLDSSGETKEKRRDVLPRGMFATKEEWIQQNKLACYSSSILMLVFEHKDKICRYVIVNKEKEADPNNRILHYSSNKARTLLSMALFPQSRVYLDKGSHYKFRCIVEKTTGEAITPPIIQKDIIIRTGGGYHEKNKPAVEVVNALLYSPFSHKLELVRASFDREYHEYYMDPTIFRRFVDSFGNPGIPIRFSGHSFGAGYENLNEESILKVYGYNVSQTEGLLTSERRAILTELVDLNIVTMSGRISRKRIFRFLVVNVFRRMTVS